MQLARLLQEQGRFEVTLACLDGDGPLREAVGSKPLEILEYPLTSLHDRTTARQLRRFASDLKARDIRLVHTHDVYSNIFGLPAARLGGVPVRIASRRDTGGVGTNGRRRVEALTYRLAQRVVTNAHAVARELVGQGVPERKVVTIHNAVDFDRVRPTLSRPQALELFGLPSDRRLVVLVANLAHDVKDHPTFLRAARRIGEAAPDAAFVVAGRGPLTSRMQDLARTLGIGEDVFFIGPCAAIGDLLAVADVCVLTSRAEGLSNAVLEYMAAGRPVVATDVGGIGEAVVEGETGYLIGLGDHDALAERVVRLLGDPAEAGRLGEAGRARASDLFSCDRLVERTVELYEEALEAEQA